MPTGTNVFHLGTKRQSDKPVTMNSPLYLCRSGQRYVFGEPLFITQVTTQHLL